MIFSATSVPTSFAKNQSHTLKYYVEVKSSTDNSSSEISKHDSAYTGTSIAYNMPDYITVSSTAYGEETLPIAGVQMGAIGGWYNVGANSGQNGTVRTEYIHSYSDNSISVGLGISAPPATIGVSVSGASTSQRESTWVYATISAY